MPSDADLENENFRPTLVRVLCGLALAEHMGDVRDEERHLWELLGIDELPYDDPAWDSNSAYHITQARLKRAGEPLPDYLQDVDDDDE